MQILSGDLCIDCGRDASRHLLGGGCPVGQEVVISADALLRLARTGHPRLLGAVLAGKQAGMFAGVEIASLTVDGESWSRGQ